MVDLPHPRQPTLVVSVALVLVLIAMAGLFCWLAILQHREMRAITQLQGETNDLSSRLEKIATRLDQQSAVLSRAIGSVIAVKMPPDWETRFHELEAQIADSTRCPNDARAAQRFSEQTAELVKGLPPWAEADYLPRLNRVRWAAMVFTSLCTANGNSAADTQSRMDVLNELIATAPYGADAELKKRMQDESERLSSHAQDRALVEKIQRARRLLGAERTADPDAEGGRHDALAVYEALEPYEEHPVRKSEVRQLRQQLRQRIMKQQSQDLATALQARWNAVKPIESKDPQLYAAAVSMLLDELLSSRIALLMQGGSCKPMEQLEDRLRSVLTSIEKGNIRREEERRAAAMRQYQRWALQEIREFEDDWGEAIEAVAKRRSVDWEEVLEDSSLIREGDRVLWVYAAAKEAIRKKFLTGWEEADFKYVRDAMVDHLLSINCALLEPPVQRRFERAFMLGWRQLDGREDQTYVAEQTAIKPKTGLRDAVENRP